MKTAIYARISKDAAGEGLGVQRQVESCRKLAEAKGWTVDDRWVLVENDTSASNGRRKEFERLIRGMERGEVSAVVAYRVDRLVRRMAEAVRLWETAQEHQVLVATVAGDLDLTTPTGRGQAMLWSVLANIETETQRDRLQAKATQQVQAGRNANAGRRPFGWDLHRVEHREDEAQIIREMADRLIAGASLNALVKDLNERQIPTAGYADRLEAVERGELADPGKPVQWRVKKVRDVLEHARHAGRVEHRGETVVDANGTPVKAEWEPILHPDVFDQVQAALNGRRALDFRWTGARRHLLSGICHCGICGNRLTPFHQTATKWSYRCRGHLAKDRDGTDRWVLKQVREHAHENPFEITGWVVTERRDIAEQISRLETQLADLDDHFVASGGSAARYAKLSAALEAQLGSLRRQRLDRIALETRISWAELDLDDLLDVSGSLLPDDDPGKADRISSQQSVVRMYATDVVIFPTAVRGRRFDPDSIKVRWRDPATITAEATSTKEE